MAVTETIATTDLEFARQLGQQLRVDSIRCSTAAGSGHPTSSMSAADLIAVLIARYLQYDWSKPRDANNDHLIYSKGHASPLCYAMFKAVGAITDAELMTFRKFGSRLQGHPTPIIPWVDVATGSLGQGLPIGVGVALAGKLEQAPYNVWILCGDSEMAEGSMWEAFEHAAFYKLDNLIAILDINRLGQRGETMHGWNLQLYADRARAFGWRAIEVDGHDVGAIDDAYREAIEEADGRPTAIGARTPKGKGVHAEEFAQAYPERYFEMFIAEQQMIGASVGLQVRGWVPFASTFAAFLSRGYDFIRMAAISRADIRLCGSHAGVSIGEDGPSQMALEDLSMMRAVYGSTVVYPSDPNQTARLVALMAEHNGVVYMRTTREKTPVLYSPDEEFTIGGSKVVRQSENDRLTVVAAGITLHEALKAYDQLKSQRVTIRVIDAYSVKPMDEETLLAAAAEAGDKFIVVEDHWPEGGLGDAVLEVFTHRDGPLPQIVKLAVQSMPGSGTADQLMEEAGISAHSIVEAVNALLQRK